MPVQVSCSHCATVYTVPDNLGKKSVKCRKCQQMFVINDDPAPPLPAPTPPQIEIVQEAPPAPVASSAWEAIDEGPRAPKAKPKADGKQAIKAVGAGAAFVGAQAAKASAQAAKTTAALSARGFQFLRSRMGEEGKPPIRTALALTGAGAATFLGFVIFSVAAFWIFGSRGNGSQAIADATPQPANNAVASPAAASAPKVVENDEPLPVSPDARSLSPEVLERVKMATVYLRVTASNGSVASGSGFFGTTKTDVVLTNAHVLGMLAPDSRQPDRVEVVLNSGESGEVTFNGKVLSVDRDSDLAVVGLLPRLGTVNLPKSLEVRSARKLFETQSVFVFGYPLGERLGKEVTVSPSQVTSFRKQDNGEVKHIQVNGGMQPGNSGGPVVDAGGNVIGVAVSIISGTPINFAVPGDKVRLLLNGRIGEITYDQPYMKDGKATVPVSLTKIDPLKKITAVGLEVWAGNVGAARSTTASDVQPGDTPHEHINLEARADAPAADVPLPALSMGKVYWFQPTWVDGSGATRWGEATVYQMISPPVERKPIELAVRHQVGSRNVQITTKTNLTTHGLRGERTGTQVVDARLVEAVRGTDPQGGADVDWGYSSLKFTTNDLVEEDLAEICQHMRALGARYKLSRLGRIGNPLMDVSRVPMNSRDGVKFVHDQIFLTLEAMEVPLPDSKTLTPSSSWKVTQIVPVRLGSEEARGAIDFQYTYLGTRERNGRPEAVVSIGGPLHGVAGQEGEMGGRARGLATFDVATGQLMNAEVKITLDLDVSMLGRLSEAHGTHEIKLQRVMTNAAP